MHLLRVRIPEFRVLKDVDITFEKEFHPCIFPLGSQNGGGKSTLLQLMFILLHCSGSPERQKYIKNILKGVKTSFPVESVQTRVDKQISTLSAEELQQLWEEVLMRVKEVRPPLAARIKQANPVHLTHDEFLLEFHPDAEFSRQALEDEKNRDTLASLIAEYIGRPVRVEATTNQTSTLQTSPLAIFEIWHNEQVFNLEFSICNDFYLKAALGMKAKDEMTFSVLSEVNNERQYIESLKTTLSEVERIYEQLKQTSNKITTRRYLEQISDALRQVAPKSIDLLDLRRSSIEGSEDYLERIREKTLPEILKQEKTHLQEAEEHYEILYNLSEEISHYLQKENWLHITNFSSKNDENETSALLCRINDMDANHVESFLNDVSQRIFLTAPSTQVCLFLSQEARMLLFKKQSEESRQSRPEPTYSHYLTTAESELPGFFTYDFIAIDSIIDSIKAARDKDFEEKIKTGHYGNNYTTLSNNLSALLGNKKLRPDPELSEIIFEAEVDGEMITLSPEDLSHGELRRLSVYAWLKSKQIEDAIVLFDEIEIAFHPDWAYRIVADLEQWEPKNQYILATHSYELCQALTPAHVKELEPKLLSSQPEKL